MEKTEAPLILGTEKISKLLMQFALPAIIAMTASSIYNIVDSIFIGHGVGALAISGLAITFPLMNLAAAFGSLVGVGASTLVSVKLGERDYEGANHVLGNVLVLNVVLGLLFTVVFLWKLDPILLFFGASDITLSYAHDYMVVILLGNIITHMYLGLNAVLRASGFPKLAMYATLSAVLINCILNPLFIFGFGWGIKGSAIATVIAQTISLAGQMIHFFDSGQLLHFKKGIYRLKSELVRGVLSIGMSPFLMNLCACLIVIVINRSLKEYGGDMAVGAYGLVNRVGFLFVMIVMGFNQGMQPIAGYNFGARLYPRVTEVTKLTMLYATGVTTLGFLLCEIIPSSIIRMFTTDTELIKSAVYGLRITFAVFPIVGFQMVATNFFTSIGMAKKAIFLSMSRQLLFLLPCLLILPSFYGVTGVWLSSPISDVVATVITSLVLIYQFRQFKTQDKTVENISIK